MSRTLPVVVLKPEAEVAAEAAGAPPAVVTTRAELERTLAMLLPLVRRFLHRMLGPGNIDDATQDALIALAQALPRFEGRASLQTFARRICLRVAYRHFSTKRREVAFDPDLLVHDAPSADAAVAERQAFARLSRCLSRLPEKRRTAFILCGLEELSPQEAAEVVGTSPGAMRSRYMHARCELMRLLSSVAREGPHG